MPIKPPIAVERLDEVCDRLDEARANLDLAGLRALQEQLRAELAGAPDLQAEFDDLVRASLAMDGLFPLPESPTTVIADRMNPKRVSVGYEIENLRPLDARSRGGCAAVMMGEDPQLGRQVAVKRSHEKTYDWLIQREAELTAKLDHPGVVPIFALGNDEKGRPFFAMRRVAGSDLAQEIKDYRQLVLQPKPNRREIRLRFRKLLGHFVSLCRTVAYAHTKGVVHRDIKPANVMVGKYGETTLIDWGIAAEHQVQESSANGSMPTVLVQINDTPELLEHIRQFRTPNYASPEQLDGRPSGAAGDVYSLGATLCELLTGQPPSHATEDAYRGAPAPLVSICRKAMAPNPAERYPDRKTGQASAQELARDVERYLGFERVKADPESWPRAVVRTARRSPALTASLMTLAAMLAVGLVLVIGFVQVRKDREDFRRQVLRSDARQFARELAVEIDARWHALEAASREPRLAELLAQAHSLTGDQSGPTNRPFEETRKVRKDLGDWLQARCDEHEHVSQSKSWFLCDKWGWQWARIPADNDTFGKDFRKRDYFTGPDNSPLDGQPLRHVRHVHFSRAYRSDGDGSWKVAFSCPIWSAGEFLGVIGMSLELGAIGRLHQKDDIPGRAIVLADLEDNGTLLHHSRDPHILQPRESEAKIPKLDESLGQAMKPYLDLRWSQHLDRWKDGNLQKPDGQPEGMAKNVLSGYADKVCRAKLAAYEPVFIEGRDAKKLAGVTNTKLVVIVLDGVTTAHSP